MTTQTMSSAQEMLNKASKSTGYSPPISKPILYNKPPATNCDPIARRQPVQIIDPIILPNPDLELEKYKIDKIFMLKKELIDRFIAKEIDKETYLFLYSNV